MPENNSAHEMRDRAESFGAVADDYDRYRPGYPQDLINTLMTLAGNGPVLDIGIGTGKAAMLLAARGIAVTGVEVDPQMAQVARDHGLGVEVASFEEWDDTGRRFPLAVSAQAWHWVDPQIGAAKLARVLRPGGTFAPFWNFEDASEDEMAACRAVYARLAPDLVPAIGNYGNRPAERPYVADLTASGVFERIVTRTFRWTQTYSVEHWVNRLGTHSDHLALDPALLGELQAALVEALTALSPEVHSTGGTYLILATTPGSAA